MGWCSQLQGNLFSLDELKRLEIHVFKGSEVQRLVGHVNLDFVNTSGTKPTLMNS
jgi:hypothetical protein